jgi:tRNA nucleotidyltransferase/poly(A) polymerase
LETFYDDPLRILRTARFASTYNFFVVNECFEAARNEKISVKIFLIPERFIRKGK